MPVTKVRYSSSSVIFGILKPVSLVRTPLNQIIGFLELALEANLDDETRHNLGHAHTASKVLIIFIRIPFLLHDFVFLEFALHHQRLIGLDPPRIRSSHPVQRHLRPSRPHIRILCSIC